MSKSFDYFKKLEGIARSEDIVKKCLDNPVYFEEYFEDDTINVWKDVRQLIIEQYNDINNLYTETLRKLVNSRISFLDGTFLKKMPIERKKIYIYNMENIEKFFSQEAIYYAFSKINIENFIEEHYVLNQEDRFFREKGYVIKKLNVKRKMYRQKSVSVHHGGGRYGGGSSTRHVGENFIGQGKIFLTSSEEKSKKYEPKFLKYCILYDFPFMKKYIDNIEIIPFKAPWSLEKVNALDRRDPILFYLKINEPNMKGIIPIPYDCLKSKSVEYAIEIHTDDCCYYYKDGESLDYHLNLLHSSIFQNFERDLKKTSSY